MTTDPDPTRSVWKYPWPNQFEPLTLNLPRHTGIVHAAYQGDVLTLWAEVYPEYETYSHTFRIYGTGWTIEGAGDYITTVHQGGFVWHIYEVAA
jgi:hypothetical protein